MKGQVFATIAQASTRGESVALGIISGVKGSSPQKLGAKALFFSDGRITGTLGGGCLEAEIQHRAMQSLKTGLPATFDLLLDLDFGWDDGLICGGKVQGLILPNIQRIGAEFWSELDQRRSAICWGVTKDFAVSKLTDPSVQRDWLYQELVSPQSVLWIAGAGHIAQAVAPLAAQLDFAVTVFDDRPALANHDMFPANVTVRADVWERLLPEPLPDRPCFGLIVTRGHRHDALVLKSWIHKPFVFLGMIGSKRKARTIFDHFIEEKLASPEQLRKVACPVGIKIGSVSVTEIAVSILAQFIEKRAQSSADSLPPSSPGDKDVAAENAGQILSK
jgi:xanthine dehydrogenase accessory factor